MFYCLGYTQHLHDWVYTSGTGPGVELCFDCASDQAYYCLDVGITHYTVKCGVLGHLTHASVFYMQHLLALKKVVLSHLLRSMAMLGALQE